MNALLLISCFLYTALIAVAMAGIAKLKARKPDVSQIPGSSPTISIVVPFRNESENLPKLIASLLSIERSAPLEIIGVDDHSEDNSLAVFKKLTQNRPDFRVLSLTQETGKKNALALGIGHAVGEYIATLDADVQIPPTWFQSVVQKLHREKFPEMLILPLRVSPNGRGTTPFFEVAENLAIQGLGFGLAAFHHPITCNGANLIFKKSAYNQCGGYQSHIGLASGDDVFLMQQMVKPGMRVLPFLDGSVVAEVSTASSWSEMIEQRLRWAGKTGAMNWWAPRLTGAILLFMSTSLILAALLPNTNWEIWGLALLWKVILDAVLIKITESTYNLRLNPLKLALVAIGYIIYLPVVSLLSIVLKPKWKGRKI